MYTIELVFKKEDSNSTVVGEPIVVRYDETSYHHDAWQDSKYLGRIRLRELFFNNYKVEEVIYQWN